MAHSLYQTTQAEILLDDNICSNVRRMFNQVDSKLGLPLTAAMTKRIWLVSVAHVKCV